MPVPAACLTVTGDLSVPAGREFTLSAAVEDDTTKVSFSWKQAKGPVRLRLPARGRTSSLTLSARWPGEYVFRCTARFTDGVTETGVTRVFVTPPVTIPVAVVSGDLVRYAGAGEWVYLSGEESHDPAGRRLRYNWSQVSGPTARVREGTYHQAVLEFLPESAGRYVFALQVEAGRERSEAAVVIVEVPVRPDGSPDHPPAVVVDYPEVTARGQSFVLDASRTSDPDGDAVAISWKLVDGPAREGFSREGSSIEFVPMETGIYRFRVNAGSGSLSTWKEIAVRVTDGGPAAAVPSVSPEKGLSVTYRTEGLDDVLIDLSRSFGIALRIDPRWINPALYPEMLIDLKLKGVSEEILVTAIARIVGGRYHAEGAHAYWIERNYSFLADEPKEPVSVPARGRGDVDALLRTIEETVKPAVLFGGGRIGRSSDGRSVIGMLPASAVHRVKRFLAIASAPVLMSGAASEVEPVCPALMRPVHIKADKLFIRDLIWNVAEQGGVSIGFQPAELPGSGRQAVSIDEGPMTLDAALKRLVELAGLASYRIDAFNVIWLYKEDPGLAGPNLWDASREAAFDLSALLKKKGLTGSLIEHLVKKRVAPVTWQDPATALIYLPGSERLVVVNHPIVIGLVGSFLEDLERTGYRYEGLGR